MIVKGGVRLLANGQEHMDTALVDTGATSTMIDSSLAKNLNLKTFGERNVTTLGAPVKCSLADVEDIVLEEVEIGPRRILVYSFPDEVKAKLKSLGCSDRVIVGVAEVESAGYTPNTATGKLERVGFMALQVG